MKRIEWSETALRGIAALDKTVARRVKQAVERFAEIGMGDVKKLHGVAPVEYRLRIGDYRVRFYQDEEAIRVLRVSNRREAYR